MEKHIINGCTLYCGDATELLDSVIADALVTDPPYGIKQSKGACGGKDGLNRPSKKGIATRVYEGDWDNEAPITLLTDYINKCRWSIVWGGQYLCHVLPNSPAWLYWDKQQTMPTFSDGELAWTNLKRQALKSITYKQAGMMSKEKIRYHPTQKPVEVMKWCLMQLPKEVETVLDPFMGSGSTGVAAVKMGMQFIGIEKERQFFDAACERLENVTQQTDLLIPQPMQENLL